MPLGDSLSGHQDEQQLSADGDRGTRRPPQAAPPAAVAATAAGKCRLRLDTKRSRRRHCVGPGSAPPSRLVRAVRGGDGGNGTSSSRQPSAAAARHCSSRSDGEGSYVPEATLGTAGNDREAAVAKAAAASPLAFKYRLTLAYDGTDFAGWQLQRRPVTVQHHVEAVLVTLTGQSRDDLRVAAAGRTDAGVHARGQVVSFITSKQLTCPGALKSLNALLPKAIRALEVAPAALNFHARLHALAKTYHYSILCAPVMDPCRRLYSMHVTEALDLESMRLAARVFVGEHDFSTFANQSTNKRRRPVRHVTQLDIVDEGGGSLRVEISGSGFLYKQVRNMVGLLVDVGRGRASTNTVMELLQSRDRVQLALQTPSAPAHGLCLVSVEYPSKVLQPPPELSEMHHGTGSEYGEESHALVSSEDLVESRVVQRNH
eukprot:SM000070S21321  [mRNA]  locus=s70:278765:281407:- [translate_table: standard]